MIVDIGIKIGKIKLLIFIDIAKSISFFKLTRSS